MEYTDEDEHFSDLTEDDLRDGVDAMSEQMDAAIDRAEESIRHLERIEGRIIDQLIKREVLTAHGADIAREGFDFLREGGEVEDLPETNQEAYRVLSGMFDYLEESKGKRRALLRQYGKWLAELQDCRSVVDASMENIQLLSDEIVDREDPEDV